MGQVVIHILGVKVRTVKLQVTSGTSFFINGSIVRNELRLHNEAVVTVVNMAQEVSSRKEIEGNYFEGSEIFIGGWTSVDPAPNVDVQANACLVYGPNVATPPLIGEKGFQVRNQKVFTSLLSAEPLKTVNALQLFICILAKPIIGTHVPVDPLENTTNYITLNCYIWLHCTMHENSEELQFMRKVHLTRCSSLSQVPRAVLHAKFNAPSSTMRNTGTRS
jgi:hypothetical protein